MTLQDMTLTAKIKAELAWAEGVSAMDINVDVNNGIVSLKGNVSRNEHDRAIELVRGIEGVRSVEDDMNITSNT